MQRLDQAQLTNALKVIEQPSQQRLPDAELTQLALLVRQMYERYPSQDLADSMEGYLWDLEQLSLKCSLPRVTEGLAKLRIKPGQNFMPRPDEVASEIERRRDEERVFKIMKAQDERRREEIAAFWAWAPFWMETTGNDEAELLRRFPSYRGTKPA
jgi:hypothetical protein